MIQPNKKCVIVKYNTTTDSIHCSSTYIHSISSKDTGKWVRILFFQKKKNVKHEGASVEIYISIYKF